MKIRRDAIVNLLAYSTSLEFTCGGIATSAILSTCITIFARFLDTVTTLLQGSGVSRSRRYIMKT